jgi:hypothetical protein
MITVPSHPVEDCGPEPVFVIAAVGVQPEGAERAAEPLALRRGREQKTRLAENRRAQEEWLAWEPVEVAERRRVQPVSRLAEGRRAARCRRESGASPPKACNDDATDALAVTQIVPRWRLPASVGNLAIDLFHERAQALGSLSASGLLVVGDPDGVADHTRELDALLLQVSRHARIVVSKAYIEELHAGSVKTELSLCQTDSGGSIRRVGRVRQ